MDSIGVRELRKHLSRVLTEVQSGSSVIVTKGGQPIARIGPVRDSVPPDVQRLLDSGRASWGGQILEPHDPVAIAPGPEVADILLTQRNADDALSRQ